MVEHNDVPAEDTASKADDAGEAAVNEDEQTVDAEEEHRLRLEAAEQEAEKYRAVSLRAKADAENAIKRAAREAEKTRKYAGEAIVTRLFEVKDNLERSLQSGSDEASRDDIQKGIELTLKSLTQIFTDLGVEEIDPAEQPFNPELHQAVTTVASGKHPPNAVIEVLQKGYRLHDRLLRPAMVVVEKTTSGEQEPQESETPTAGKDRAEEKED